MKTLRPMVHMSQYDADAGLTEKGHLSSRTEATKNRYGLALIRYTSISKYKGNLRYMTNHQIYHFSRIALANYLSKITLC